MERPLNTERPTHGSETTDAGDAGVGDEAPSAPSGSSTLQAIAYVSHAEANLTEPDLERLLISARERNVAHGITGVLLYHDGNFFQYFEGPAEGVQLVWAHIRRSQQHSGIVQLMRAPIRQRAFAQWLMGFTHAPKSFLLQLADSSWQANLREPSPAGPECEGLALLRHFWTSARPHHID